MDLLICTRKQLVIAYQVKMFSDVLETFSSCLIVSKEQWQGIVESRQKRARHPRSPTGNETLKEDLTDRKQVFT